MPHMNNETINNAFIFYAFSAGTSFYVGETNTSVRYAQLFPPLDFALLYTLAINTLYQNAITQRIVKCCCICRSSFMSYILRLFFCFLIIVWFKPYKMFEF